MEINIRDYNIYYWITALSLDVLFNVGTVLVSFFSFYKERDKFFKDANFRNEAVEKYEKEKAKNKIQEEQHKKTKSKSEHLPADNQNKTNNIDNNDINNPKKNEIFFNQLRIPEEEKKYTYQDYLKSSQAQVDVIKLDNEQRDKNDIIHIDSKNQFNTNPCYTNVNFYTESNLVDNNKNKIDFENCNKDFGEDLKNVERIEKDLLSKYRKKIRCGFIITIVILIIDAYSNIDTFINLKPRFLDTQFILYNNSFLINEKNFNYNRSVIYAKYLNLSFEGDENDKSSKNISNPKNRRVLSDKNNSNKNLKFLRLLINNSLYYLNSNKLEKNNLIPNEKNPKIPLRSLSPGEEGENKELEKQKFIYSNLQEYVNISLKSDFNISNCRYNSKSDLDKIDFIYEYSAVRYSLLIINTILDLFIILLTTLDFLYKVEINKLYKSRFILVLLFLLNKCWSMCAVAYSYFDLTTNECLNAIEHFDVFFYTYLSYVFLFFSLIFIIILYSLFCRQLLYYILFIVVTGVTLFIPAIFCLEKQQKCMQKIYETQEMRLKDDLVDMRNLRFKRKKQNFQLWMAYLVFLFIVLTGLSALVNYGILKYIWIENSWRTFVPAVGSITTFVVTFFQRCFN